MGKAPTFMLIKSIANRTKNQTRPQRPQRPPWAAACRNYRKPPNSSWPDRLGINGKNWSGFQQFIFRLINILKWRTEGQTMHITLLGYRDERALEKSAKKRNRLRRKLVEGCTCGGIESTPLLFASAFSTAFGKTLENRKECLEKSMRRLPPKVSAVKGLTPHCRGISWH